MNNLTINVTPAKSRKQTWTTPEILYYLNYGMKIENDDLNGIFSKFCPMSKYNQQHPSFTSLSGIKSLLMFKIFPVWYLLFIS